MGAKTPYIKSKNELKEYIKRRLGYPVINVEITDEQLEDVINETIEKFIEVAYPGIQLRLGRLKTEDGKMEYDMPYEVAAVVKVFGKGEGGGGMMAAPFGMRVAMAQSLENVYFQKLDLISIELMMEYIETLGVMFYRGTEFDYNTMTKKLYLFKNPGDGELGLLFYEYVSEEDTLYIYDHRWIKKYATELARLQWGRNLMKYAGSMLPSGLQMNAEAIISEAKEELQKLDEELETKYQLPVDFFIG